MDYYSMKPLNYDDNGCNNISSNCVIWQGPDIKCINLCKGDTVSDVIYKLATELCEILDILNIDSYALDCFAGTNEPATFKELIQLIITQLCDIPAVINNINNRINTSTSGACPDCVLNLPTCFQYVNGFGDTVTEAQLTDYVTSIGNRVCQLIVEINTIQIAVADNTARITILENTPPPVYIPPTVTPTCVLPSVPTQMNDVLSALETQFNMWLTICDLRTAVRNIQLNCCPSGCDGISITLLAVLDGTNLTIYVNGTIPTNFVQCSGTTQIKISDTSGTSSIVTFDLQSYLNSFAGFTVNLASTPLNTALDLTVEIEPCLSDPNTGTVCKSCLSYTIISTANCPEVTLTAESTAIDYSFTSLAGNYTYTIELYDNTYGTLLQTQTQAAGSTVPVTGSFTTLTSSTQYHIRVSVVPTACLECPPTVCPFNTTTTLPPIIL